MFRWIPICLVVLGYCVYVVVLAYAVWRRYCVRRAKRLADTRPSQSGGSESGICDPGRALPQTRADWDRLLNELLTQPLPAELRPASLAQYLETLVGRCPNRTAADRFLSEATALILRRWNPLRVPDVEYAIRLLEVVKAAPSTQAFSVVLCLLDRLTRADSRPPFPAPGTLIGSALACLSVMDFPQEIACSTWPHVRDRYVRCLLRLLSFSDYADFAFRSLLAHLSEDELVFAVRNVTRHASLKTEVMMRILHGYYGDTMQTERLIMRVVWDVAISKSDCAPVREIVWFFPRVFDELQLRARTHEELAAVARLQEQVSDLAQLAQSETA